MFDVQQYWHDVLCQNREALSEWFTEDAWINWHNTNEHFTVPEFVRANCEYPGSWDGEVERKIYLPGQIVTVVHVHSPDQALSFHVTSFFRLLDGRIEALDEYWGDDGPPPQWRREMNLGREIPSMPMTAQKYRIVPYAPEYRDDMIFMVLEAKNALGRMPRINDDLLDIPKNYQDRGDFFWLALDENDRVIGSIGYNSIPDSNEARLHRLYIKPALKRQGIGTALLRKAEDHLRSRGKTAVQVHLGGREYFESRRFYPKHGYREMGQDMMRKDL